MTIPTLLILALISVESQGNVDAVGAHGEVGCLQIKQIMVDDVNRIRKLQGGHYTYRLKDAKVGAASIAMLRIYLEHYAGEKPSERRLALLWHYGPSDAEKLRLDPDAYWPRVIRALSNPRQLSVVASRVVRPRESLTFRSLAGGPLSSPEGAHPDPLSSPSDL